MDRAKKEKILQELGGIPEEVYDGIVGELFSQMDGMIAKLQEAIGQDDYDGVAKIAHAIKGSSANLRIEDISSAAKAIEESATGDRDKERLQQKLRVLESTLTGLRG